MRKLFILFLFFYATEGIAAPSVKYRISFEEPRSHYVKVQMEVRNLSSPNLELKMPVWTPGSYLVREYSRFVERFTAYDTAGKELKSEKFRKNGWRINCGNSRNVNVTYYVYAFELSVRTSFVDEEHAYLTGASLFMYLNNNLKLPCTLEVKPYSSWKKISTALDKVEGNPWLLAANDFDEFIDAPIEIGNHVVLTFKASGVDHEIALFGQANYDSARLISDITNIVAEEVKIFGEHPCKRYVFIIHNIPNGSGGLEHKNSTTLQVARNGYSAGGPYNSFLSLAAHEYFHLWNVKRLRPASLGPFDYDNENYTNMLYVAEGFTAYYDDLITRRCGFIDETLYFATVAGYINSIENTPGNYIQPLSESSYDAWIKYYRASENNSNATISYYTKGALIGCLLDLYILGETGGEKRLDDVMKLMYNEFYKKQNRGYTDSDFISSVEKICGHKMNDFFSKYVYDTDTIHYNEFFSRAGLKIVNDNAQKQVAFLGANTSLNSGKLTVTGVERNSPAWIDGLNVNDEIIAIDNARVGDDLSKIISVHKPGDVIRITVSRIGLIKNIDVKLGVSGKVSYSFTKEEGDSKKEMIYKKWISAN